MAKEQVGLTNSREFKKCLERGCEVGAVLVDHRAAPGSGGVVDECAFVEVDESLVPFSGSASKVGC